MKRKHKIYSRPRKPYDKARIDEERGIVEEFGLKNKKEIWRADARIKEIREKAKKLITASTEEQKKLFERLKKIGFKVNSIGDVLSLDKTDYLGRRLQTVLVEKRLAKTPKAARQMITHRKVVVGSKAINSPSYIVPVELEDKIIIKMKKSKPKNSVIKEKTEEVEVANA
ncbi:MAG: 30S ribosomal protein S4 [Candidatus Pacearchaeota archaeon]